MYNWFLGPTLQGLPFHQLVGKSVPPALHRRVTRSSFCMHKGINTKKVSSSKAAFKKTLILRKPNTSNHFLDTWTMKKVGNPENSPVAGWWLSFNPFGKNVKIVLNWIHLPQVGVNFSPPRFAFFLRWTWPVLRNYEPPFDPLIKVLNKAIFF